MSLLNYLACIGILHVYKLVTFQTCLLFRINQDYKSPKYDLIILYAINTWSIKYRANYQNQKRKGSTIERSRCWKVESPKSNLIRTE